MSLDDIDWTTITRAQACRFHKVAEKREARVSAEYEDGEATVAQLRAAMLLEEDLWIFALTGRKPDSYCRVCGADTCRKCKERAA